MKRDYSQTKNKNLKKSYETLY